MANKKFLNTPADIIDRNDIRYEEIYIAEWDAWVMIRGMTAADRDLYDVLASKYQAEGRNEKNSGSLKIRALAAALCIVHSDTKARMFSIQDIEALTLKNGAALDTIFEAVQVMSGMGTSALKRALENFKKTQANGSNIA